MLAIFKKILQKFVVKTNFWPFNQFYKLYYNAVLKIIVYVLKGQKEIAAIYLTAGMATENYICGLSDIDLIIIIEIGQNKQKIDKIYRRLSKLFPVLKYEERSLFSVEEIFKGYDSDIFLKYKFSECKEIGRLLYGRNILNDLPALDQKQKKESVTGRLAFIWAILVKYLLIKDSKDTLMRNYLCYKLSADSYVAFILARDNKKILSRQKALELSENFVEQGQRIYIKEMRRLPGQGFALNAPWILQETYAACFDLMNSAAKQINITDKYDDEKVDSRVYFDFESLDFILSDKNKEKINSFINLVNEKYKDYIQSVLMSASSLVGIDEESICLFIIQKAKIPFEIIKQINSIINSNQSSQYLYIYIITSDVAFSLNRADFKQLCTALFLPNIMPLSFLFLSTSTAALFGAPLEYKGEKTILINYFLQSFLESDQDDEKRILELINDPNIVRLSNIKFHLLFWQALQLKLIKNSAISGLINIPLSSAQVCYCWNNSQAYKINWLEEFHDEYKKDLNGISSNSEAYFLEAITVLKNIYNLSFDECSKK